eukprot:scaffold12448_cov123-Isochrysis_galbana.AAC.3
MAHLSDVLASLPSAATRTSVAKVVCDWADPDCDETASRQMMTGKRAAVSVVERGLVKLVSGNWDSRCGVHVRSVSSYSDTSSGWVRGTRKPVGRSVRRFRFDCQVVHSDLAAGGCVKCELNKQLARIRRIGDHDQRGLLQRATRQHAPAAALPRSHTQSPAASPQEAVPAPGPVAVAALLQKQSDWRLGTCPNKQTGEHRSMLSIPVAVVLGRRPPPADAAAVPADAAVPVPAAGLFGHPVDVPGSWRSCPCSGGRERLRPQAWFLLWPLA